MIEIGYVVTLDAKDEYMVLNKLLFEGKQYLLLINVDKSDDYFIAQLENDEIIEVTNPEMVSKLALILLKNKK